MKDKLKKNIVKKTLPNESDKMSRRHGACFAHHSPELEN